MSGSVKTPNESATDIIEEAKVKELTSKTKVINTVQMHRTVEAAMHTENLQSLINISKDRYSHGSRI